MITGAPLFFGVLISPSAHAVPSESCAILSAARRQEAWSVRDVRQTGLEPTTQPFSLEMNDE
jgi:hypothetical protein